MKGINFKILMNCTLMLFLNFGFINLSDSSSITTSPVVTFKKIQSIYHNFKTIELDIRYTVKDYSNPKAIIETFKAKSVSSRNNYYIQSIDSKSIFGNDLKLTVSDIERMIIVEKRDSIEKPKFINYNIEEIDSFNLITKNGLKEVGNDKIGILSYQPLVPMYSKVDLLYDKETYKLKGFNLYLADSFKDADFGNVKQPVIEIRYLTQKINLPLDEGFYFNTNTYIKKSGKKYIGIGKYQNYEIIDLDIQNP